MLDRTGLSHSADDCLTVSVDFPQAIEVTERSSAWVEADVDDWVASKILEGRLEGNG